MSVCSFAEGSEREFLRSPAHREEKNYCSVACSLRSEPAHPIAGLFLRRGGEQGGPSPTGGRLAAARALADELDGKAPAKPVARRQSCFGLRSSGGLGIRCPLPTPTRARRLELICPRRGSFG